MQEEKIYKSKINGQLVDVRKLNEVYIVTNYDSIACYCPIVFKKLYEKVENSGTGENCESCELVESTHNPRCHQCYPNTSKSNWRPIPVQPVSFKIRFTDDEKDRVYRTLAELQYNIDPSFSEENKPVLIIPKDGNDVVVSLGDIIEVVDGEIVSVYTEKWERRIDKYGCI